MVSSASPCTFSFEGYVSEYGPMTYIVPTMTPTPTRTPTATPTRTPTSTRTPTQTNTQTGSLLPLSNLYAWGNIGLNVEGEKQWTGSYYVTVRPGSLHSNYYWSKINAQLLLNQVRSLNS